MYKDKDKEEEEEEEGDNGEEGGGEWCEEVKGRWWSGERGINVT